MPSFSSKKIQNDRIRKGRVVIKAKVDGRQTDDGQIGNTIRSTDETFSLSRAKNIKLACTSIILRHCAMETIHLTI